jgi:hypothetical protein
MRDMALLLTISKIMGAVATGVGLRGTAQRLPAAGRSSTLLGVWKRDGKAMAALQLSHVGEQRGDFTASILIDAL